MSVKMKELLFDLITRFPVRYLIWPFSICLRPLKKWILNSISNDIKIERAEANILPIDGHPPINLRIILDSKVPLKIEIDRVVLRVYLGGSPFDTFIWSREEKDSNELGTVDDLKAKSNANIIFEYTPPMYAYFTIDRIYLKGYIKFKCFFGIFHRSVNQHFDIKEDMKKDTIRKLKEYYKPIFES